MSDCITRVHVPAETPAAVPFGTVLGAATSTHMCCGPRLEVNITHLPVPYHASPSVVLAAPGSRCCILPVEVLAEQKQIEPRSIAGQRRRPRRTRGPVPVTTPTSVLGAATGSRMCCGPRLEVNITHLP